MDMMLDTDRGQFDCPLCKRLSNLLIPVTNRANTPMNTDKDENKVEECDDKYRNEVDAHAMEGVENEGTAQHTGKGPQDYLVETSAAMRGAGEVRKRKTVSISSHFDGADNSIEETLRTAHESQRPALSSQCRDKVGPTVTFPIGGDRDADSSMEREGDGESSSFRNQCSDAQNSFPMDVNVFANTETDTDVSRKIIETATVSTCPASFPIPLWMAWMKDPRLVKKKLTAPTGVCACYHTVLHRNKASFSFSILITFTIFSYQPFLRRGVQTV